MPADAPTTHAQRQQPVMARQRMVPRGLAVLLATAALACAATPPVVDFDAENPPFMFARDGHPAGLYPALIAVAYARCNVEADLEVRPWKRALAELDRGQAGVGGIYKNEERLQKYDFSDPLYVENIVVYVNTARPVLFLQVADLYGKRVGVIRGWSYGEAFDAARRAGQIAVEEVGSDRSNFRKLVERRLDAVLAVEQAGQAIIAADVLYSVAPSPVYLSSNPTHLAFNKLAGMGSSLECFNHALAGMKQDGTLDRLVRDAFLHGDGERPQR